MRDRTADLLRAKQALSQLSYSPKSFAIFARLGEGKRCVWDIRELFFNDALRKFGRTGQT